MILNQSIDRLIKENGIKPEKININYSLETIGFSESQQRWYGWSPKAICGFGRGSKIQKGSIAYIPFTPEELIEEYIDANDPNDEAERQKLKAQCRILPDRLGIMIFPEEPQDLSKSHNIVIKGQILCYAPLKQYKVSCGLGAWQAHTLTDAKRMAIDFALRSA